MGKRLSANDIDTLLRADDLKRRFDAGIFPSNGGQARHFARLERLGYLVYVGTGRDIDREVDRDVQIYKLTDAGRAVLADPIAKALR